MSSASNTPPESYFNDLSRPTGNSGRNKRGRSPSGEANAAAPDAGSGGDSTVPKPKRIACIICRKRKLKCDGTKPSCSTCTRLGHSCAYDEVRRKSGPKRGYVKALEERLSAFSFLPALYQLMLIYNFLRRASRDPPENPRTHTSRRRCFPNLLFYRQPQRSCVTNYSCDRFHSPECLHRYCKWGQYGALGLQWRFPSTAPDGRSYLYSRYEHGNGY